MPNVRLVSSFIRTGFLEEQAAGTRQSEPGKEFGLMIPRNRLCGHEGSSLPPMKNWGIASPCLLEFYALRSGLYERVCVIGEGKQ